MKFSIGDHRKAVGDGTKRAIEAYFEANPFAKQYECARELNISTMTVSKHFKVLRAERMPHADAETA